NFASPSRVEMPTVPLIYDPPGVGRRHVAIRRSPQARSSPERGQSGGAPMKVNHEIDCTPDVARRCMGLPDVEQANAVYVDACAKAMQGAGNVDQLQEYARQRAPMGQMGLKMFQSFVESARKASAEPRSRADDDPA